MRMLACLLCACLTVVLTAQDPAASAAGIRRLDARQLWNSQIGYAPILVELDLARPLEISVRARVGEATLEDRWQAPAGRSRRTLLLPPGGGGFYQAGSLTWRSGAHVGSVAIRLGHEQPDLIHVGENRRDLQEVQKTLGSEYFSGYHSISPLSVEAEDLPDRWQAYPYQGFVLLDRGAWERLEDGQRRALVEWAHHLGTLYTPVAATAEAVRAAGGRAKLLRNRRDHLLGHLKKDWSEVAELPGSCDMLSTGGVPANLFILLAVVFMLLVGPGSLLVALRTGKRHLLLILTPCLSLVACVLLFGFNFLAEGFATQGAAAQLVFYDAERKQATAWTAIEYFSSFGVDHLELEADDAVYDLNSDDHNDYRYHGGYRSSPGETVARTLDWTTGQLATGTWVPNRAPRRLLYINPRPFRGRLQLEPATGGEPVLTNGLDVALEEFFWRDTEGRIWSTTALLQPGQSRPLSPDHQHLRSPPNSLGRLAHQRWRAVDGPHAFHARCQSPLLPLPGPDFEDHNILLRSTWFVCGHLRPTPELRR